MRSLLLLILLTAVPAWAVPNYTFVPGKSFGPVALGQSPEQLKQAFKDLTYDLNPVVIGDVYTFPKSGPQLFNCSFTPDHRIKEITLSSNQFKMQGDPSIGPGASQLALQSALESRPETPWTALVVIGTIAVTAFASFFPTLASPLSTARWRVLNVVIYPVGQSRFTTK